MAQWRGAANMGQRNGNLPAESCGGWRVLCARLLSLPQAQLQAQLPLKQQLLRLLLGNWQEMVHVAMLSSVLIASRTGLRSRPRARCVRLRFQR